MVQGGDGVFNQVLPKHRRNSSPASRHRCDDNALVAKRGEASAAMRSKMPLTKELANVSVDALKDIVDKGVAFSSQAKTQVSQT